ncbi:CDP-alcohol phosphatidyltransferase family protein [Sphaerisporangium siamense]|uniref:Phosphatidylglycerophosphate synthase n=1 Tax=Sphaerisporangium siamense TaxID=795645 RepID=A0A7W7DFY1_9ACTN|nr:CDP-alcohol phosphatidyltransferase family protein [Sphaerisporangium siamense]MBB4705901.1 phosphatidylglycerophosphate synthase [Sphaerisporangium siamense]
MVLATTPATRLTCAEGTLADRLAGQLVTLHAGAVHLVTRPAGPPRTALAPSRPAVLVAEPAADPTPRTATTPPPPRLPEPSEPSGPSEPSEPSVLPGPAAPPVPPPALAEPVTEPLAEPVTALPPGSLNGAGPRSTRSGGLIGDLRAVAALARSGTGPLAVLPGDLVAHTEALALLLADPAHGTGALVTPGYADGDPALPPVRYERGRIVAAGNSFHTVSGPNGAFRGVVHIAEADLDSFADVADELANLAQDHRLGEAGESEVTALLLAGLVRVGVPVRATPLGGLHCERVTTQPGADAAIARLGEVDEGRARLRSAIKSDDGLVATYLVSSWSGHLVRAAARLGLTPNAVTGLSVGLAGLAAVAFSAGERRAQVAGAALLYLSFVLDCVDGQLARYTRAFSPIGAWLDATFDRVKEYVVYVGLAVGYAGAADGGVLGPDGVWAMAIAAMLLQSVRHMVDFSYADSRAQAHGRGGAAEGVSARPGGNTAARRLRKLIVLPIGERMALIAVTAALFNARVTFLALLAWGGLAALYTLTGRIARSF